MITNSKDADRPSKAFIVNMITRDLGAADCIVEKVIRDMVIRLRRELNSPSNCVPRRIMSPVYRSL